MSAPFFIADDAISMRVEEAGKRRALAEVLRKSGSWLEVVAGRGDVSVRFDLLNEDPRAALARFSKQAGSGQAVEMPSAQQIDVPICYAPQYSLDLRFLSETLNLPERQIIDLHLGGAYTVDMIGFTPGFAYIEGANHALNASRLRAPRAHLKAGSVGLAGGQTGIYALDGPGGWPIIGRTPLALFKLDRDPPFLLVPGMKLRFFEIEEADFKALLGHD